MVPAPPGPESVKNPCIFVVEDDDVVRLLLEHIFTRRGFTVHTAADGQQALSRISELPIPDSVLLDVMLPHVDGVELLRHIRRYAPWQGVPIVMLTSKAYEKDIMHAFANGADDYVTKPFRTEELVIRIKRLIK